MVRKVRFTETILYKLYFKKAFKQVQQKIFYFGFTLFAQYTQFPNDLYLRFLVWNNYLTFRSKLLRLGSRVQEMRSLFFLVGSEKIGCFIR